MRSRYLFQLNIAHLLVSLLFFAGCVRSFTPPTITSAENILVVDGFINAGNDSTYIYLSRSGPLSDTTVINAESMAALNIEGNDNSLTPLQEITTGTYTCPPLYPGINVKYRIHIITSDGKEYRSEFVPVLISPPIDSVNWARTDSGSVTIYVNTHSDMGGSRYFRWTYTETWEFHSIHEALWTVSGPNPNYRDIYTCWHTEQSSELHLGTSSLLSNNVIYELPIEHIVNNSWKISVDYSILVRQQSLDLPTYSFFQNLQKNTEKTGSLFDPQPSTISGNIHNINDASEIVLGELYCSSSTENRIFIHNVELPDWYIHLPLPNDSCAIFPYSDADAASVINRTIIRLNSIDATSAACGDCTLNGTNIMPTFWQ